MRRGRYVHSAKRGNMVERRIGEHAAGLEGDVVPVAADEVPHRTDADGWVVGEAPYAVLHLGPRAGCLRSRVVGMVKRPAAGGHDVSRVQTQRAGPWHLEVSLPEAAVVTEPRGKIERGGERSVPRAHTATARGPAAASSAPMTARSRVTGHGHTPVEKARTWARKGSPSVSKITGRRTPSAA